MTKEQKEILKTGNDILIANIGASISSNPADKKAEGRKLLKEAIAAGDSLDKIKTSD